MRWIGLCVGALAGSFRGGFLGGIVGSLVGDIIEGKVREELGKGKKPQGGARGERAESGYATTEAPDADDPYGLLGCRRDARIEELRSAYREKVKQLHPDVLRSRGISGELAELANAQMRKINAAWEQIKKERGI